MMKSRVLNSPLAKACLTTGAALSFAFLLIGCGQGTLPTNDAVASTTISGTVHGGQQPVSGATVQLYQVGTTGYGKGSAALGTATTSDANGNFSLTGNYTCPSTSTLVYLVVTGGNPGLGTGTNSNLKLTSALGTCGSLTGGTSVVVNEVTTAAMAYALSQYFTTTYGAGSTDAIGSPNTTQALTGIANAFTTAQTLANINSGFANTSLTTNGAGGALTVLPESAKLYTVANILAACVNSAGGTAGDGSACGTLFADSGPTGTTPTDTLQAAVLLNLNPTSTNANGSTANITALYGLVTSNSPFVGVATQPTDWTVGIEYTGTATTMGQPQSLAIDAGGNVWVVNNPSGGGSLNEITPGGSMLVDTTLATSVGGTAVSLTGNGPRNVAVDLNGTVWVPSSTGSAYVFDYTTAGVVNAVAVGKSAYGIAIDAGNNVWIGQSSSSETVNSFQEFLGGNLSTGSQVGYPVVGTTTLLPQYMAFDANGNLWASSGSGLATATNIVEVTNTSSSSCTSFPCTTGTATYTNVSGLGTEPFGLAATATAMIAADAGASNISSVTLTNPTATNFGSASSLDADRFPAVDGAGNIWLTNRNTGGISEFTGAGAVLSPVPASGATAPIGFVHSGLGTANGIGIDPSGNVWAANNVTTGANAYSVFEIVGAAAPAVTPLALALKTNAIGIKP